jgi:hypothetical protein
VGGSTLLEMLIGWCRSNLPSNGMESGRSESNPAPAARVLCLGGPKFKLVFQGGQRSMEGTMTAFSFVGVAKSDLREAIPPTYSFKRAAERVAVLNGTTRLRRGLDQSGAGSTSPIHDDDRGPLTFERRRLPRKVMKGGGVAVFTQDHCAGTVVRVELVDGSHTGLGILSPVAIEPGTSFSLIPDHAMMPRAVGMAVRCDKVEGGYHIGLRTRIGSAAA